MIESATPATAPILPQVSLVTLNIGAERFEPVLIMVDLGLIRLDLRPACVVAAVEVKPLPVLLDALLKLLFLAAVLLDVLAVRANIIIEAAALGQSRTTQSYAGGKNPMQFTHKLTPSKSGPHTYVEL